MISKWFPQSLGTRVFAVYCLVMALFLVTGLTLFYRFQFVQHIDEAQESAGMLMEVAAQAVGESVLIGDYDAVKRTLAKTLSGPAFSTAQFIDLSGGIIQLGNNEQRAEWAPSWLHRLIAQRMYDANRNITIGGKDYGVIRLTFEVHNIAYNLWHLAVESTALAAAFLIISALLMRALLKRWLGNLDGLRNYEERVLSGDVAAEAILMTNAPAEIQQAIRVVNRTAASLRDHFGQQINSLMHSLVQHKSAVDEAAIVCEVDTAGTLTYVNQRFADGLGYSSQRLIGLKLDQVGTPAFDSSWKWVRSDSVWHSELPMQHRDGNVQWHRRTIAPMRNALREIEKYICIDIDITDRKRSEEALIAHAMRQSLIAGFGQQALKNADPTALLSGAVYTAAQGLNVLFCALLQADADSVIMTAGVGWQDGCVGRTVVLSGEGYGLFAEKNPVVVDDAISDARFASLEFIRSHGIHSAVSVPIVGTTSIIGILAAYSQTRRLFTTDEVNFMKSLANTIATAVESYDARMRLTYLAEYDTLTDLPNRPFLMERLESTLIRAQDHKHLVTIMFIDLDRFKIVNDTLGHGVGDRLLVEAGKRIRKCIRENDIVARLGGDEFAIVMTGLHSRRGAEAIAEKIIAALSRPFSLIGHQVYVSASIGIATCPDDAIEAEDLLQCADTAMYSAKRTGRNTYRFYAARMKEEAVQRLHLESHLRQALVNNEFQVYYQPKITLATGDISGFEALLRWNHPKRGLLGPNRFISVLEETGLVIPIGEWVLQAVCRQIKQWQCEGIKVQPIAINLSAKQFERPDLIDKIKLIIEQSDVDPSLLDFELTESMLMADPEAAASSMQKLKKTGVRLSIDDFGTGYSSLAYLKRFPLDALKIDRTFIRDVCIDADDAAITLAVINLAHNLKLKVVAEGVDNSAQLKFLKENGCDEVQGYYFSRPIPAYQIATMLKGNAQLAISIKETILPV
jgi:diguanylate cyclase (GGDEF)-like protein/PAS domain S-box-containing protein